MSEMYAGAVLFNDWYAQTQIWNSIRAATGSQCISFTGFHLLKTVRQHLILATTFNVDSTDAPVSLKVVPYHTRFNRITQVFSNFTILYFIVPNSYSLSLCQWGLGLHQPRRTRPPVWSKCHPRDTPAYAGSLDKGGAVLSATYALVSVGLSAISLVNYKAGNDSQIFDNKTDRQAEMQ